MAIGSKKIAAEIEAKTFDRGGAWATNHAKRLIAITSEIAEIRTYDREVVHLAAYLHDWGGYEPWKQPSVDHAKRSAEAIPQILSALGASEELATRVAECARTHHCCDSEASVEAVLLHDADAIDFLGITGLVRNFSMFPRELRRAFDKTKERLSYAREHLLLTSSQSVAKPLLLRTEETLNIFEQETDGLF